ncbi:hypothetical protein B0H13DRAFT_2337449 [Mycena leptocephala]|nr:hypothetical protein B0H13DRAFT_2337449 [Mycena leptocephala]
MFRLAATFAADLTVSSGLRVPPLLPCRSYFRTAFVAAKHRKPPKIPVGNSKNLNLPKNTRLPNPLPTKAAPPPEPSEPPPRPLPPQKDSRTSHSTRNQLLFAGFVSCGGFLWAAAQTNAETDVLAERLGSQGMDKGALFRAKVSLIAQEWRRWGNLVAEMTENLPAIPRSTIREAYISMAQKFVTRPTPTKYAGGSVPLTARSSSHGKSPALRHS